METDTKKQRQHFYRDYASGQWSIRAVGFSGSDRERDVEQARTHCRTQPTIKLDQGCLISACPWRFDVGRNQPDGSVSDQGVSG